MDLTGYKTLLEQYHAALDRDAMSVRPGSAILSRLDAIWAILTPLERQEATEYARELYARRLAHESN